MKNRRQFVNLSRLKLIWLISRLKISKMSKNAFLAKRTRSQWVYKAVRTKPDKFKNSALFLRKGLPSTLIRHENGAFRKRSSNRKNLKTPAFRFRVDGKHSENGAFRKTMPSR